MSSTSGAVGSRVPQLEGAGKVSGAIRYTHDIALPGMLFAAVLRSPHPHARIVSIDVAPALAVEGVCDAIVATDFPDRKYINLGPAYADRYPMARGVVRFVGEEVAAVAASSRPGPTSMTISPLGVSQRGSAASSDKVPRITVS